MTIVSKIFFGEGKYLSNKMMYDNKLCAKNRYPNRKYLIELYFYTKIKKNV